MVKSLFLVEGEFNSLYAIWGLHYVAKIGGSVALRDTDHKWWTGGVTLPDSLVANEKCCFYHYRPIEIGGVEGI